MKTNEELHMEVDGKASKIHDLECLLSVQGRDFQDLKRQLAESQAKLVSIAMELSDYAGDRDPVESVSILVAEQKSLQAALAKSEAAGAAFRHFIEVGVECKCDSASNGGYTCPRCELLKK
jgi:hypothetical protein